MLWIRNWIETLYINCFCIVSFQIHDDLEKEPEYSGSGFGPDDEDSSSSTHHNKPTSHHTNNNSGGRTLINRKQTTKSEQIVPNKTHNNNNDDDDLEIGSGDKVDNDDEEDGDDGEGIDEGEDVHKNENGEKASNEYDDKDYDEEDTNSRMGAFDTDSSPKVTVPHILVGNKPEKKVDVEDEDDFTTYVKKTEIDSTTTTVTEERQLHGFVFLSYLFAIHLIYFVHPNVCSCSEFDRTVSLPCEFATKRKREIRTRASISKRAAMCRSWFTCSNFLPFRFDELTARNISNSKNYAIN